jgi:hypothetical protein
MVKGKNQPRAGRKAPPSPFMDTAFFLIWPVFLWAQGSIHQFNQIIP